MALRSEVKPDPGLWLPLLAEYRLTSLPNDTLLQGTLRPDLVQGPPALRHRLERHQRNPQPTSVGPLF